MKRLNQQGFSIGVMIGFISFFLIIMIAIIILAYNYGIAKNAKDPAIKIEENMFVPNDSGTN